MKYNKIRNLDISNGEGCGVSVFTQGCNIHCPHCFNKDLWDSNLGKEWTAKEFKLICSLLDNDYIDHLTEDIGVDGLRLDSMKMIGLPEENGNMFLTRVFESIAKSDLIVYGEIIYEKKELLKKYQKYVNVLVNLSADAYEIDRNKEFVFFESHDSYHADSKIGWSYRLNDDQIIENYGYLCKDFSNTVFYLRNEDILKRCKEIQ